MRMGIESSIGRASDEGRIFKTLRAALLGLRIRQGCEAPLLKALSAPRGEKPPAAPYPAPYMVPASFLSSVTGTTNPWRGAMVTTSSFRRSMFAFRFLVKFAARGAGGGPFGAGGVKWPASTTPFA